MAKSDRRIVCLFGSGISIPAGMPNSRKLTLKLLYEEAFWQHTDGTYYSGTKPEGLAELNEYPRRRAAIRILLKEIWRVIQCAQLNPVNLWYQPNYEDIAFMLRRLWDARTVPVFDPAVFNLESQLRPLLRGPLKGTRMNWLDLLFEAQNRLTDLVWQDLARPPRDTSHLEFFAEMTNAFDAKNVSIVTTNHDVVIESHCRRQHIAWVDGFENRVSSNRCWEPEHFDLGNYGIQLYKVHGSTSWFRAAHSIIFADPTGPYFEHPIHGKVHFVPFRPLLLIGTVNKSEDYTFEMFAELYCRARRAIMSSDCVFACGYGFGDRGINQMLWDWSFGRYFRGQPVRLIIAHKNHNAFYERINPGVVRHLEELRSVGVFEPLNGKWVQDIEWKDIEALLK